MKVGVLRWGEEKRWGEDPPGLRVVPWRWTNSGCPRKGGFGHVKKKKKVLPKNLG